MNKLKTILLLLAATVSASVSASRAVGIPRTVTLQSGEQVTVRIVGDENLHFLVANDGKVVMQEGETYRYATLFEIETFRIKAQKIDAVNNARLSAIVSPNAIKDEGIYDYKPFPHTGRPKVLTIMVNFSDYKMEYSKEETDKAFNGTEYNDDKRLNSYSSVAQYFDDCSGGKFRPQFDIVGPVTLEKGAKYYGKGNDNTVELLTDACEAAAKAGVDFSQYDNDGDGYVDLVYIYYAGYGPNWGADNDFFWPKAGYTGSLTKTYNGKHVYRFAFNQELFGYPDIEKAFGLDYKPRCGIGVMVHEFSHCMGLPDFYPTSTWLTPDGNYDVVKYDNQSMEMWDLMDNGSNLNNGYDPIPYSAWEKELMGWTEKMPVLDTRCDVTLQPLQDGGEGVRIVNDSDPEESESWILENVPAGNNSGWYRSVPGGGMLVTHIDYEKQYFSNLTCPNNEVGHPRVTIVPADGKLLSSYRSSLPEGDAKYMSISQLRSDMKGDPFPLTGEKAVDALTDYKAYRGTMDKPITKITRNDDGSISFKFMGGDLMMGDVNGDGQITVADANATANYCIDKTSVTIDVEAADMNGDGEITVSDANAIANEYVKQ